jgi:voltage-gated potassium channel
MQQSKLTHITAPSKQRQTMQKKPQQTSEKVENVTVFQICLLVLSLTMVVALLIDTVAPAPPDISKVLQGADFVVCMLLLIDFVVRLKKAENKKEFMRLGWIDLIASIPNVDLLRMGRLVRILRIIRLIRGLRAGHRAVELFLQHRPRNVLASVLTTTILLITFSSIGILIAETSPESNIKGAEDAVWVERHDNDDRRLRRSFSHDNRGQNHRRGFNACGRRTFWNVERHHRFNLCWLTITRNC